jgi:hypothetical protein
MRRLAARQWRLPAQDATMRRRLPLLVAALAVLLAAAFALWRVTTRTPSLDAELSRLPAVVDVQSTGPARPQATVIHLLDWHLVPREMLAPPGLIVTGRSRLYADHLDAVEAVQTEHEAILRHLAAKHGRLTVFVEELTDAEVEPFVLKAQVLAKADAEEITEAKRMLDEVKAMKQTPAAKATADEIAQMIAKHRAEVLGLGATLRLIAEGLVEVRALDDAEALRKAKPRSGPGPTYIDPEANAAREEEMAKRLAGVEGLGVVILGGKHDLTDALKRQAPGLRYLRVATKAYQEAAGE